jgi:ketosteroid isomerase-like protein
MSQQNLETMRSLYAAFAKGDVPTVLGSFDAAIEWHEAENFLYAEGSPYIGPGAILQDVFLRLATEWDGFTANPQQFFDAGETIIVTGRYSGVYKATGKKLDAQVAHFWTLADGKVTRFRQYTDTLQAAQVAKA